MLFGFVSAKHERLLSLLEERSYDQLELFVPSPRTPRGKVAEIAARMAIRNYGGGNTTSLPTDDLPQIVGTVFSRYYHWYMEQGFNVEIALTGSKLQAVAASALSAATKVSECIYVSPKSFDPRRFTKGVDETRVYELRASRTEPLQLP